MAVSAKPKHLKRYTDIARLAFKYGRKSLDRTAPADEWLLPEDGAPLAEGGDASAEQFASDLEKLGPTFIKIGQFLSTRPDFVPLPYVEALDLSVGGVLLDGFGAQWQERGLLRERVAVVVETTLPAAPGGGVFGGIALPNFQLLDAPILTEMNAGPWAKFRGMIR